MGIRADKWLGGAVLLLPAVLSGGLLMASGEIPNGIRLFGLALPGCAFLWLAARKRGMWKGVAAVWWLVFFLHTVALSSTQFMLGSSIDAYFIVRAASNTHTQEILELVRQHWELFALAVVGVAAAWLACLHLAARYGGYWQVKGWAAKIICALLALLAVAAYAMKPNRIWFPPLYWAEYARKVDNMRQEAQLHTDWQQNWRQEAAGVAWPQDLPSKQTHVLVIDESLTALNMQVCGYPRPTTPEMAKRADSLAVFCRAYSPYPTTVESVKAALTGGDAGQVPASAVMARAQAAGFKVFWLSNQDDLYLSSLFSTLADVSVLNNKRSGRSSSALDEELLPHFQTALADPAQKKLIILHFIGAHPNYAARYPASAARFPNDTAGAQAVARQLADAGAGMMVRQRRDEYDNAVAYQDALFGRLFDRMQADSAEVRSLVWLSDHGNEVGHERDYAGHSPNTEAGYRVPLVLWRSPALFEAGVRQDAAVDTSLLDVNLLYLMGLDQAYGVPAQQLWTKPEYRFEPVGAWPYWQQAQ